jgi:hypothetical protein
VPQRNLHEVHASVGEHAGALYEPLSCVAQCLCDRRSPPPATPRSWWARAPWASSARRSSGPRAPR